MPVTSRKVLFNDGEGIAHEDFNDLVTEYNAISLDRRFYADIVGAQAAADGGSNYKFQWNNADFAVQKCYVGGGIAGGVAATKDGLTWTLSPGMYYQYVGLTGIEAGEHKLLEFQVDGDEVTGSVTAPGSGQRFDRLEMKLEEVDGEAELRDFKDAITGALTTTNVNKRKRTQATFQIRQGILNGGITQTGDIDGFVPIAYISVTSAGIQAVYGCTHPMFNGVRTYDMVHSNNVWSEAGWVKIDPSTGTIGYLNAASPGDEICFPFPFQSRQRILGIAMFLNPGSGTSLDLRWYRYLGGSSRLLIDSVNVTGLTASTDQSVFIDFMPEISAASPGADVEVRKQRTIWTNYDGDTSVGQYSKRGHSIHFGNHLVFQMDLPGAFPVSVYEFKVIYAE